MTDPIQREALVAEALAWADKCEAGKQYNTARLLRALVTASLTVGTGTIPPGEYRRQVDALNKATDAEINKAADAQRDKTPAIASPEIGVLAEREAVIAWLRSRNVEDYDEQIATYYADCIARGDHLRSRPTPAAGTAEPVAWVDEETSTFSWAKDPRGRFSLPGKWTPLDLHPSLEAEPVAWRVKFLSGWILFDSFDAALEEAEQGKLLLEPLFPPSR